MRFKIILLAVFTFCCAALWAQDTTQYEPLLTLHDAIDIAMDQNYDIRVAAVSLQQSKANNTIGNAGMLPTVSAVGSLTRSVTDARVELAAGGVQNRDNAHYQAITASAQLDWIVFDGLRMFVAKKRLNEVQDMSEVTLKRQVQNTLSQVLMAYCGVVYEKQQLVALDTAMSLAQVRMNIAKKNFEVGTAAKTDYLQAQVDYNAARFASLTQDARLRQVKDSLMLLLGRDQFARFDVEDSMRLDTAMQYNEKEVWIDNNFDLRLAAQQKRLSEFDLQLANKALIPTLDLNAAYNYSRTQNDAGATLFNRVYGPQVGLNLNVPIFNGFNLQRQKKVARLEVTRQELQVQFTKARVAAQYRIAWRAYANAILGWKLERENIQYAAENVMIQQARFRVGVSNQLELREAENSYVEAMTRLVDANYAVKTAEIKLLVIQNRLVR